MITESLPIASNVIECFSTCFFPKDKVLVKMFPVNSKITNLIKEAATFKKNRGYCDTSQNTQNVTLFTFLFACLFVYFEARLL